MKLADCKTIGLLSNAFPGSAEFLDEVAARLAPLATEARMLRYSKGVIRDSTEVLSNSRITQIASECEAVIAAYGHCGSCTSALVRDSVALAREGVAVAVLVTAEFLEISHFVSRAAGMASIPIVELPHPMANKASAQRREIAGLAFDQIVFSLEEAGLSSLQVAGQRGTC